jgi:hypothetical protein
MAKKSMKPRLYTLKQIEAIAELNNFSLMTTDERMPQITVSVDEEADPFGVFSHSGSGNKFKFTLYFP